jgi:hypothetical protein
MFVTGTVAAELVSGFLLSEAGPDGRFDIDLDFGLTGDRPSVRVTTTR